MADMGFKISKAGDDVKTAALKDLRFNSEKGAFKIFKSADANFTTNGSGDATATIAHNLDYPPAFFSFRKATARYDFLSGATEYSNAYFPVGSPNFYVKDDNLHHAIHSYADEDNVYIQAKGGKPSTSMDFRSYMLVDQSAAFSGADGISLVNDYGLKVSKPGFDVLTAKEYQMAFSSKYKILQYYEVNKKSQSITLPGMQASYHDTFVEEGVYIDFIHGLGYPPLTLVFFDSPTLNDNLVKAPVMLENGIDTFTYNVSYFIDSTRIRVYFWRSSIYFLGTVFGDWAEEEITVRILPFTENLAGAVFP